MKTNNTPSGNTGGDSGPKEVPNALLRFEHKYYRACVVIILVIATIITGVLVYFAAHPYPQGIEKPVKLLWLLGATIIVLVITAMYGLNKNRQGGSRENK